MNRFSTRLFWAIVFVVFVLGSASAQSVDPEALLQRIDENLTLDDMDFSSVITLVSEDPEDGIDRQRARMFRRDSDDAFVLLTMEPEVNRGQGYLQIDDGLWFYDPEARSFSFTSLSESFGGTDARLSDFESSSLAEDYRVASLEEGQLGNFPVYVLELEATSDEVTYPYRTYWVTRDNALVLKSEDYSVTRRLLRTTFAPRYTQLADSFVATQVILVDELVPGRKTTMTLAEVSSERLPDSIFTKAYVERVSR